MTMDFDRPFWIKQREMVGDDRQQSLRAPQTSRPKIDRTASRLRLRGSEIDNGDA